MARLSVISLLIAGLSGCGSTAVEGTLVDGITSEPVAGVSVLLSAVGDARLTCQKFESKTGEDGTFRIDGACLSETSYEMSSSEEALFFADAGPIDAAAAAQPLEVKVWRAPAGSGLYKLSGGELETVGTNADLAKETLFESEETVRFPKTVPATVPVVSAGEHLVVTGSANYAGLKFVPLLHSDTRKFGDKTSWVDMEPWWYMGTRFTSDTEWERVSAELDASKVVAKDKGDRAAYFLSADALPPGRYVITRADAKRVTVVDFGAAQTAPEPATD